MADIFYRTASIPSPRVYNKLVTQKLHLPCASSESWRT